MLFKLSSKEGATLTRGSFRTTFPINQNTINNHLVLYIIHQKGVVGLLNPRHRADYQVKAAFHFLHLALLLSQTFLNHIDGAENVL